MILTRTLISTVRTAVRDSFSAARVSHIDIGLRARDTEHVTANSLLWADEADLFDLEPLNDLRDVEPDSRGYVVLDAYVYGTDAWAVTTSLLGNRDIVLRTVAGRTHFVGVTSTAAATARLLQA